MSVRALPDEMSALRLRHRVTALHDLTGAPIAVDADVAPRLPAGWKLTVRGGDVLLSAWDRAGGLDAATAVELTVRDPALRARLSAPEAAVAVDAPAKTHRFAPAPAALEIELRRPDGSPSAGKTVLARAGDGSGATVALTETGPGIYRSPDIPWTPEFHPLEVVADGDSVRKLAVDPTARVTRARLIDPT